ncbi:MAG: hypothetical protein FWF73_06975 [Spirochaetes bacterium]|nr:hypothetical protein [Spirochaetota bacterium]
MKKFFTITVTLLIASSAFAQEQEAKKGPEFTYGARAWLYGVTGQQKDLAYDYSHFRIRPMFSLGMEDIKLVTHLEISQTFGRDTSSGGAGAGYAGPATDNYSIKIKGAYLEAKNVIIPNLTLMGGLNGYKYPFVVDNDFGMFTAGYDFGMGKANLSYIKLNEYELYEKKSDGTKQNKDAQAYALDVPIKVDKDITVRPGLIYIQGGKNHNSDPAAILSIALPNEVRSLYKTSLVNAALNVTGKVDMISFTATGAYLTGTLYKMLNTAVSPVVEGDDVKTSAYAFDLGVDAKPNDMFKIGAFVTYATGNDNKKADENNNYFRNMEGIFGRPDKADGAGYGRLFIFEAASVVQVGGNYDQFFAMEHPQGYMSYGVNAEAKIDKVTIFAQFGIAQTAEKDGNGKTSLGSEIDAKISYALASKTALFAEFGYVLAGDIQFNKQSANAAKVENMYQVAFGMTSQI